MEWVWEIANQRLQDHSQRESLPWIQRCKQIWSNQWFDVHRDELSLRLLHQQELHHQPWLKPWIQNGLFCCNCDRVLWSSSDYIKSFREKERLDGRKYTLIWWSLSLSLILRSDFWLHLSCMLVGLIGNGPLPMVFLISLIHFLYFKRKKFRIFSS